MNMTSVPFYSYTFFFSINLKLDTDGVPEMKIGQYENYTLELPLSRLF